MSRSRRTVKEREPWIIRFAWSIIRPVWALAFGYFLFMGHNINWFPLGLSKNPDYSPFAVALLLSALVLAIVFFVLKAQGAAGKAITEIQAMKADIFEDWVAARFRGLGYSVKIAGTSGDHGADLVVEKDGETAIVQCKNFKSWSVGEPVLRDLFGAMHDFGANRAFLVTTGRVTQAARDWAGGKPIEIWDKDEVARLSRGDSATESPQGQLQVMASSTVVPQTSVTGLKVAPHSPDTTVCMSKGAKCPKCGSELIVRRNRTKGEQFLACPGFPACRYTQPLATRS